MCDFSPSLGRNIMITYSMLFSEFSFPIKNWWKMIQLTFTGNNINFQIIEDIYIAIKYW